MIHRFPKEFSFGQPDTFTDPFRYFPHESVRLAASLVIRDIDSDPELCATFSEGKMLGVLLCDSEENQKESCYLAAFSGNAGGHSCIEGFVPPIYDLTRPDGHFRQEEAKITAINKRITELTESEDLKSLHLELSAAQKSYTRELEIMRAGMAISRSERKKRRETDDNPETSALLIRESQHEKAELKRLKVCWEGKIRAIMEQIESSESEIRTLKKTRAKKSEALQDWIFSQYIVHNASGEHSTIADIFSAQGLTPPGGTGECAAPKLLEYAYRNGLRPIAMGEFWYGKASKTAVRTQGRFYPSCTSKCGPLLGFMLKGVQITHLDEIHGISPRIIYEDSSIIGADKPGGMPSVPGLDKRKSLQEWLSDRFGHEIYPVHRLDMDTSGIIIYAKTKQAESALKSQFEARKIRKTYTARLSATPSSDDRIPLQAGSAGTIELPLSADYDERPRQKVDMVQGKPAVTSYKVISENADGTTDILFEPLTGRTHQLRVHAAHHLGLRRPIVGDLLYGGDQGNHLHLKAVEIVFTHPESGEEVRLHI